MINPKQFDTIARTVFAPVYPLLAEQIITGTGITSGTGIDLGSGGGYLGLAVANHSNLKMYLLDESPGMFEIATRNCNNQMMADRVIPLCGDVHYLPFEQDTVNLVVSRGSIYFWDDLAAVLCEIWRVLAPGGHAYIGGGFGSPELKAEVIAKMREKEPDWQPKCTKFDDSTFVPALTAAGIFSGTYRKDGSGAWITFQKPLN